MPQSKCSWRQCQPARYPPTAVDPRCTTHAYIHSRKGPPVSLSMHLMRLDRYCRGKKHQHKQSRCQHSERGKRSLAIQLDSQHTHRCLVDERAVIASHACNPGRNSDDRTIEMEGSPRDGGPPAASTPAAQPFQGEWRRYANGGRPPSKLPPLGAAALLQRAAADSAQDPRRSSFRPCSAAAAQGLGCGSLRGNGASAPRTAARSNRCGPCSCRCWSKCCAKSRGGGRSPRAALGCRPA